MQIIYAIKNLKVGKRGAKTADLTENGVVIARLKQGATTKYFGEFKIKFLSDNAKNRFDVFCDCLTFEETCEALGF